MHVSNFNYELTVIVPHVSVLVLVDSIHETQLTSVDVMVTAESLYAIINPAESLICCMLVTGNSSSCVMRRIGRSATGAPLLYMPTVDEPISYKIWMRK